MNSARVASAQIKGDVIAAQAAVDKARAAVVEQEANLDTVKSRQARSRRGWRTDLLRATGRGPRLFGAAAGAVTIGHSE